MRTRASAGRAGGLAGWLGWLGRPDGRAGLPAGRARPCGPVLAGRPFKRGRPTDPAAGHSLTPSLPLSPLPCRWPPPHAASSSSPAPPPVRPFIPRRRRSSPGSPADRTDPPSSRPPAREPQGSAGRPPSPSQQQRPTRASTSSSSAAGRPSSTRRPDAVRRRRRRRSSQQQQQQRSSRCSPSRPTSRPRPASGPSSTGRPNVSVRNVAAWALELRRFFPPPFPFPSALPPGSKPCAVAQEAGRSRRKSGRTFPGGRRRRASASGTLNPPPPFTSGRQAERVRCPALSVGPPSDGGSERPEEAVGSRKREREETEPYSLTLPLLALGRPLTRRPPCFRPRRRRLQRPSHPSTLHSLLLARSLTLPLPTPPPLLASGQPALPERRGRFGQPAARRAPDCRVRPRPRRQRPRGRPHDDGRVPAVQGAESQRREDHQFGPSPSLLLLLCRRRCPPSLPPSSSDSLRRQPSFHLGRRLA